MEVVSIAAMSFSVAKTACCTVVPDPLVTSAVMVWSPSGSPVVSKGADAWVTEPGEKSKGEGVSARTGAPAISGASSHQPTDANPASPVRNGQITPATAGPSDGPG